MPLALRLSEGLGVAAATKRDQDECKAKQLPCMGGNLGELLLPAWLAWYG